MESVASGSISQTACGGCLRPSDALTSSAGDRLCGRCKAVFLAAAVLLNEGVVAEDTLIPTLVFAKAAGGSPGYKAIVRDGKPPGGLGIVRLMEEAQGFPVGSVEEEGYVGWEFLRVVRGVPLLRVLPLAAVPEMHPGTRLPKSVRIQVLSRRVETAEVRQEYERVLIEQGASWSHNNAGAISYAARNGFLEIEAGTGGTVSPLTVESVGRDKILSWPACTFPPPALVAGIYGNLLGSVDKRNAHGFAFDLDLYGKAQRKTPKRIVNAFSAWHVGEGHRRRVPPKSRPRVAGVLNRQLLDPDERLPENTWSPADKVWSDVEALSMRFVRLYAGGSGGFVTGS